MAEIDNPGPLGSSAAGRAGIAGTTDATGTEPSSLRRGGDTGMCAVLAGNWWAVALRGLFAILFGLIAMLAPGSAILSLLLLFSAYMLADGIAGIVSAVRAANRHERWGLLLLEGLADIATGVIALLWPGMTVVAFVLLMAVWALTGGVLRVGAALKLTGEHGRWWLALSGLVSIVFGVLLATAPLWGARVLTWWLGIYALVFGGSLLVVAFKLRMQKDRGARASATLSSGAG